MTSTKKKVCILAAGRGTRMGPFSGLINKALLPLRGKAAITWIIEQLGCLESDSLEYVIALGFDSANVKDYLRLAHPNTKFYFVDVNPYEGSGSGPGMSALQCSEYLREPFYLCCSDTLWLENPSVSGVSKNWLACAPVDANQSEHYCNFKVEEGLVKRFFDKQKISGNNYRAFTGLAFIHDTKIFFDGLKAGQVTYGEIQLSSGFESLQGKSTLGTRELKTWIDVGTLERYQAAKNRYELTHFKKDGEFFYHVENRVLKFSNNVAMTTNRLKKYKISSELFPKAAQASRHFFSYQYFPGKTLYELENTKVFEKLLSWLKQEVWQLKSQITDDQKDRKFYHTKTLERIRQFEEKFPEQKKIQFVNGKKTPWATQLIDQVDWTELSQWHMSFIHGDLQFNNIIYNEAQDRFVLIDWRPDFSGMISQGDLYYDFAKLLAGLRTDFRKLETGSYRVDADGDNIRLDLPGFSLFESYEQLLKNTAKELGLDYGKIRVLASLVLLNMAGIHSDSLATALYHAGREWLHRDLSGTS